MSVLKPDDRCRYLTDVTPERVRALHCKAVLIDADNTSSYDLTSEPLPGTEDWIAAMKEAGIPVLLLSNAKAERAKVLADRYGIPVVGLAMKPAVHGYWRAAAVLRESPTRLLMLGDQLFTDVLGANLAGCRSIWVEPFEADKRDGFFLVKRRLEQKLSKYWETKEEGKPS